ncbi:MAG: pyridoxamine 5'-phosphate oxidase family protein [Ilumatobacteraceae bacterium]|nr:pyridoxamine 5'-phosphate oxidase family protein [Ilumatobacteraceae bacterium]
MSDEPLTIDELRERVEEVRIVMATTIDEHGLLSSRPLTVQRIDENGDVYFIVGREADWAIGGQAMNVSLVDDGRTWISVVGRAEYVEGTSLLSDLWDEMTDTYFPDGPESAVALQVHADRWEYWTAPNKLAQMAGMAKAFLMDSPPDVGESGTVDT